MFRSQWLRIGIALGCGCNDLVFRGRGHDHGGALKGFRHSASPLDDWGTALVAEDTRKDYGEQRFQAIGFIDDRLHVLLFTPRPPAIHVISLRMANEREEAKYDAQNES